MLQRSSRKHHARPFAQFLLIALCVVIARGAAAQLRLSPLASEAEAVSAAPAISPFDLSPLAQRSGTGLSLWIGAMPAAPLRTQVAPAQLPVAAEFQAAPVQILAPAAAPQAASAERAFEPAQQFVTTPADSRSAATTTSMIGRLKGLFDGFKRRGAVTSDVENPVAVAVPEEAVVAAPSTQAEAPAPESTPQIMPAPGAFIERRLRYNNGHEVLYRSRKLENRTVEQFWLADDQGRERLVEQRVWSKKNPNRMQISLFEIGAGGKLRIIKKNIVWKGEFAGYGDSSTTYLPNMREPLRTVHSSSEYWNHPYMSWSTSRTVTYFRGMQVLNEEYQTDDRDSGHSEEERISDGDHNILWKNVVRGRR
jgi:hypothetical protein